MLYEHPYPERQLPVSDEEGCATECSLDALCTAAQYHEEKCVMYSYTEGYARGIALPDEALEVGKLIVARPCDAVAFAGTGSPGPATEQWLSGAVPLLGAASPLAVGLHLWLRVAQAWGLHARACVSCRPGRCPAWSACFALPRACDASEGAALGHAFSVEVIDWTHARHLSEHANV